MADQTNLSHAPKEPRLHGVVDLLRSDRVAGWVIDRTDPARCAMVEVRREGRLVGTVKADRPRRDLERQAVGTGTYGFVFPIDPPLEEGMEFTVSVTAKSHDGVLLPLQPAASAARSVSAEKKALGRLIGELAELRTAVDGLRSEVAAAGKNQAHVQERVEIVQLRIEKAISAISLPEGGSPRWLAVVAIAGAVMAAGSLAAGFLSLWAH